jgi:hypothetical protein
MDWGVAQVVQDLPCKFKTLNSNPSPTKKKKNKKKTNNTQKTNPKQSWKEPRKI